MSSIFIMGSYVSSVAESFSGSPTEMASTSWADKPLCANLPQDWAPLPAGYSYSMSGDLFKRPGDPPQIAIYHNPPRKGFINYGTVTSHHGSALILDGTGEICAHRDMASGDIKPFSVPGSWVPERIRPCGIQLQFVLDARHAEAAANKINKFNYIFYPKRVSQRTLKENRTSTLVSNLSGIVLTIHGKNTKLFIPPAGYDFVRNRATGKPAVFENDRYLLVARVEGGMLTEIVGRVIVRQLSAFEYDLSRVQPWSAYAGPDLLDGWIAYAAANAELIAATRQFIQDATALTGKYWLEACREWESAHAEHPSGN